MHRDTFGNNYREWDLCIDGFEYRRLGELRWHEDHTHIGAGRQHRRLHVIKNRDPVNILPGLTRSNAGDYLGTGCDHATGVLSALRTGHALNENPAIAIEPDCHVRAPLLSGLACSCQFGNATRSIIHGVNNFNKRVICIGQDAATFNRVISIDPAHNRL